MALLYKMTSGFSHAPITCDGCFQYGHATVWMSAAFLIITFFLVTISQINLLASRAADLFRKADVKDYDSIGGRDAPLRCDHLGATSTTAPNRHVKRSVSATSILRCSKISLQRSSGNDSIIFT